MNILLTSVGRRPYLVRWFQEALADNDLAGRVIAADLDEFAPARAFADDFVPARRVDDPGYRDWLGNVLVEQNIGLVVSINDFELSEWSLLPQTRKFAPLVRLSSETQALVEDKFTTGVELDRYAIANPKTWLGSAAAECAEAGKRYVTKGRFGSASRGLRFTDAERLEETVAEVTHEVTTRTGGAATSDADTAPADFVIIQEEISGIEYGLDVVCDLNGSFVAVFARRKIAMRAGETDRAEAVDPAPFVELGRRISEAIPHPGSVDVDVIVDKQGEAFVIDINPRLGGGYPFSHLAGARVPQAYVAWASGRTVNPAWLKSTPGIVGGKYVEAVALP